MKDWSKRLLGESLMYQVETTISNEKVYLIVKLETIESLKRYKMFKDNPIKANKIRE